MFFRRPPRLAFVPAPPRPEPNQLILRVDPVPDCASACSPRRPTGLPAAQCTWTCGLQTNSECRPTHTSGCSTPHSAAITVSSRAVTASRKPGASSSPCWTSRRRPSRTRPVPSARQAPTRSSADSRHGEARGYPPDAYHDCAGSIRGQQDWIAAVGRAQALAVQSRPSSDAAAVMAAACSCSAGVAEAGMLETTSFTITGIGLPGTASAASTASPRPALWLVVFDGHDVAGFLLSLLDRVCIDRLDRIRVDHPGRFRPRLVSGPRAVAARCCHPG